MSARADEDDDLIGTGSAQLVDQEEIATDVTLAMIRPIARELMISVLGGSEPSLAMIAVIAAFNRRMSYRPLWESRSQSFVNCLVLSAFRTCAVLFCAAGLAFEDIEQLLGGAEARGRNLPGLFHRGNRGRVGHLHLEGQAPLGNHLPKEKTNRGAQVKAAVLQNLLGTVLHRGLDSRAHYSSLGER
jgi:hypothetical protein